MRKSHNHQTRRRASHLSQRSTLPHNWKPKEGRSSNTISTSSNAGRIRISSASRSSPSATKRWRLSLKMQAGSGRKFTSWIPMRRQGSPYCRAERNRRKSLNRSSSRSNKPANNLKTCVNPSTPPKTSTSAPAKALPYTSQNGLNSQSSPSNANKTPKQSTNNCK